MERKYNPNEVKQKIRDLIQQTLQEALEAELEEFLGYSKYERSENDNYRNGYTPKTVKTDIKEPVIYTDSIFYKVRQEGKVAQTDSKRYSRLMNLC